MMAYAIALIAVLVSCVSANTLPATDAHVKWVGRTKPDASSGVVYFDWEGVSATVTISNFTYLTAQISDGCMGTAVGGGSRWLVTMTTSNANVAPANHRISVFWSSPILGANASYILFSNPGARCDPACSFTPGNTTFTLTRLTESRLSGCSQTAGLSVNSFSSDGVFLPPPPPSTRRLEFIGDSITAGDLNDGAGASVCGNAAYNDDITLSTGGQLCLPTALGGFGADCMYTAWGGIQLGIDGRWGMSTLYPYTFSASGTDAYEPWDHSLFPVDAVVVNLGTNDRPAPPALDWQAAYVTFVTNLTTLYASPTLPVFLAYGPMSTEYQPFVTNITATLQAQGISAHLLDLTLPHPMTGCYGHPSAADNVEIAAKAKGQIAAVLGW